VTEQANANMETDRNALETGRAMITSNKANILNIDIPNVERTNQNG